ncbi:MAG TPA: hypothetical protein VKB31_04880 [Trueperaceae bacterium]|nr:hypothetical protein [Trueperaceae bacterium]
MKRTTITMLAAATATLAISVALAASGGNAVQTRQATVNGKQETILTTSKGMSLYYFDKDSPDTSTCTGRCAKLWPAYILKSGQPTGPSSIAKGLKVFQGANGRQVEYHGHPLYTYVQDQKPGDLKGVGIFPTWHVATASLPAASASGSSSAGGSSSSASSGNGSSSGSGYSSGY